MRYGIGYDNVDLAAAREHGVDVCNAPTYGVIDVAEHTMALLLAANRKVLSYDAGIRGGRWGKSAPHSMYRLNGAVMGLVGFGRIAQNVAQHARGFRMNIIVCDPYIKPEDRGDITLVSFEELLRTADYISLHAPLTVESRYMIRRETLALCKPNAILVNTSRGGLVDTDALAEALQTGVIRAAGLDVLEAEPISTDSILGKLDNVVLSPHIAWLTEESKIALHEEVTAEVERFLQKKPNLHVVNR